MAKIYYLSNTDITAGVYDTLAEAAPSVLSEDQSWKVGKTVNYWYVLEPDTLNVTGTADPLPTAFQSFGYRTTNALSGLFATGTWTLYFKVKSNSYYAQDGKVEFRLWRSTNADGSSATQITAGWNASSLITFTAANQYQTGSVGVSINSFSLTNEYLFLEVVWHNELSGGNNNAAVLWVDNEGSTERLEAPTFTPYKSLDGTLRPNTRDFKKIYPTTKTASLYPAGVLDRMHTIAQALAAGLSWLATIISTKNFIKYGTGKLYGTGHVYHEAIYGAAPLSQSLSAGLQPVGSILNKTGRGLIGSLQPVGVLFRRIPVRLAAVFDDMFGTLATAKAKVVSLAGTFGPVGVLFKSTAKKLLASLAWAASVATQQISGQVQKSLVAGIQFAGQAPKKISRALAAGLQFPGVVIKSATRFLQAGMQSVGQLVKRAGSHLYAGLSWFAELSASKAGITMKSLAAGLSPVGAVVKKSTRSLLASIQPVGQLFRGRFLSLAGAIRPAGVLASFRTKLLPLVGSLQPVGQLTRKSIRSFAAGLQSSGQVFKQTFRPLLASLRPSGALVVLKALFIFLQSSQQFTGKLVSLPKKWLSAALQPAGALARILSLKRTLTASLQFTGQAFKQMPRVLLASLRPTAILSTIKGLTQMALTASMQFAGQLFNKTKRTLLAGLQPTSVLATLKFKAKALAASLRPTGAIVKRSFRSLSAAANFVSAYLGKCEPVRYGIGMVYGGGEVYHGCVPYIVSLYFTATLNSVGESFKTVKVRVFIAGMRFTGRVIKRAIKDFLAAVGFASGIGKPIANRVMGAFISFSSELGKVIIKPLTADLHRIADLVMKKISASGGITYFLMFEGKVGFGTEVVKSTLRRALVAVIRAAGTLARTSVKTKILSAVLRFFGVTGTKARVKYLEASLRPRGALSYYHDIRSIRTVVAIEQYREAIAEVIPVCTDTTRTVVADKSGRTDEGIKKVSCQ